MSKDTICVIGSTGFIGSHVTAELLRQGYSVRGTSRDPDDKRGWMQEGPGQFAQDGAELTLHAANLKDRESLEAAMKGCSGVVMSAGVETQEPDTVALMMSAAKNTLEAADRLGIDRVVFTSSTGSTNPPGGEPELKKELEHWSDADQQITVEKFSPAAKTLMERLAISMGDKLDIRVAILNPSLILGPAFQPEKPSSLHFLKKIIDGEKQGDRAWNGSMSIIDVRDLAALHVAALESDFAINRYFGVKKSWHWQDILEAIERVHPDYAAPDWPEDEERATPSAYDLTRQKTLGVTLRDLDEILAGAIESLG